MREGPPLGLRESRDQGAEHYYLLALAGSQRSASGACAVNGLALVQMGPV